MIVRRQCNACDGTGGLAREFGFDVCAECEGRGEIEICDGCYQAPSECECGAKELIKWDE